MIQVLQQFADILFGLGGNIRGNSERNHRQEGNHLDGESNPAPTSGPGRRNRQGLYQNHTFRPRCDLYT